MSLRPFLRPNRIFLNQNLISNSWKTSSLSSTYNCSSLPLKNVRFFAEKPSKKKAQRVELNHLGVASEMYIHPSKKNLPSIFSAPKLRFRGAYRRLLTIFQMTLMVAQFRLKSGYKPRFMEWKNLALELYVTTNKAFVANKLDTVRDKLSIWVYESLQARLKTLPAGTMLDWKLLKFNSTPKIMWFQSLMLPGEALSHCQIVYRIESRQRLAKISPDSSKPTVSERDVTDYIAFTFDISKTPAKVIMSGSVFETPLDQPRPDASNQPQNDHQVIASMKQKGDIFRSS